MFDTKLFDAYFLGANTADGFCSEFAKNFDNEGGWKAYIIKGGPGTGKSTLMKKTAMLLNERGERVTVCPCSSDPDSLDAIIVQDKKLIMLDGTAPHVVEPIFPGVCEQIVNLGDAFKKDAFLNKEKHIIELSKKNSALHAFAARYVCAAGRLIYNSYLTALKYTDTKKANTYADNLLKRLVPAKKDGKGKVWSRFLMSPSCGRVVSFCDTLNSNKKIITIDDEYFAVSSCILQRIAAGAERAGYEVICCLNPFVKGAIDHVIIPELSTAFCVKNRFYDIVSQGRTTHFERFLDTDLLYKNKNKLNFNKKSAQMLIDQAVSLIKEAKAVHDKIEEYYIAAMDYKKLDSISKELLERI